MKNLLVNLSTGTSYKFIFSGSILDINEISCGIIYLPNSIVPTKFLNNRLTSSNVNSVKSVFVISGTDIYHLLSKLL